MVEDCHHQAGFHVIEAAAITLVADNRELGLVGDDNIGATITINT